LFLLFFAASLRGVFFGATWFSFMLGGLHLTPPRRVNTHMGD
jgi:hypothetical protein